MYKEKFYISKETKNRLNIQRLIEINDVVKDILSVINVDDDTTIYLEGYSYGQSVGPLIDLIGIGSSIRSKLYENIPNIVEMKIIAPKSLKLITCEMAYGAVIKDIGKRKPKIVKVINNNDDND